MFACVLSTLPRGYIFNIFFFLGVEIGQVEMQSAIRTCVFSYSGNMAVYSTDSTYGMECGIVVIDVRNADASLSMMNIDE